MNDIQGKAPDLVWLLDVRPFARSAGDNELDGDELYAQIVPEPDDPAMLVTLSDECLRLAKGRRGDFGDVARAIENGVPADIVAAKLGLAIPLRKLIVAIANERDRRLCVRHQAGIFRGNHGISETKFDFPTPEARNDVLAALCERFGPKAKYKRTEYTPLRAALAPVFAMVFIAAITAIFVWVGYEAAAGRDVGSAPKDRWFVELIKSLVKTFGADAVASGFIMIGVVLSSVALWHLVKRIKHPPITRVLKAKWTWK
jgi:hypothetical protein